MHDLVRTLETFTRCRGCGRPQTGLADWHCRCGGIFSLTGLGYGTSEVTGDRHDITRYRAFLPLPDDAVVLGAGWTPTVETSLDGHRVWLKDERANPTGSFKDRGMAVLANAARGVDKPVFVDSVGNTAAALAAYARELGLDAHVFAPLSTSAERARILADYGARLHRVAGPRAQSGKVAMAVAGASALYLSHIYQPLFQVGTATCAFEIFEQMSPLPDRIFTAVGQGTLYLGLRHGFRALVGAGVITRAPALIAVRPEVPGQTIAVGAAAVNPVRGQEYRLAADATGGAIVTASDTELRGAHETLIAEGFEVDPAASLAVAGWRKVVARGGPARDVIVLCGALREPLPVEDAR